MTSTALAGPYRLTYDDIEHAVKRKGSGTFATGYLSANGDFCIRYVGRSDSDLATRLRGLIGSDQVFKFAYAPTAHAAFAAECSLFHAFRPPGNLLHPERPSGTNATCPYCQRHP